MRHRLEELFVPELVLFLEILLAVYFFFTVVAIFKGAAPILSRRSTVKKLIEIAKIQPGESVIDLGSGDGRILLAAAKCGARSTGYEINPFLIWYSRIRAKLSGASSVTVLCADLWTADVSQADIVITYMVPKFMDRMEKKLRAEMKPGSRVVVAVYPFPNSEPSLRDGKAYLYRL